MVTKFTKSKHPMRAVQAWLILTARARNRQTLTYGILDDLMQYGAPVALGTILDHIQKYCQQNELPPLTILVVNKATGLPGTGMGDYNFSQQEEVFEFDWYSIVPPTPAEFEAAFKQA